MIVPYLDSVVVFVLVVLAMFAPTLLLASVNGGEEDQIDDEEEGAQHERDAQSRLVGPEVAESTRHTTDAAADAVSAAIHSIDHRRRTRLRCHDVGIHHHRPVSETFIEMGKRKNKKE